MKNKLQKAYYSRTHIHSQGPLHMVKHHPELHQDPILPHTQSFLISHFLQLMRFPCFPAVWKKFAENKAIECSYYDLSLMQYLGDCKEEYTVLHPSCPAQETFSFSESAQLLAGYSSRFSQYPIILFFSHTWLEYHLTRNHFSPAPPGWTLLL